MLIVKSLLSVAVVFACSLNIAAEESGVLTDWSLERAALLRVSTPHRDEEVRILERIVIEDVAVKNGLVSVDIVSHWTERGGVISGIHVDVVFAARGDELSKSSRISVEVPESGRVRAEIVLPSDAELAPGIYMAQATCSLFDQRPEIKAQMLKADNLFVAGLSEKRKKQLRVELESGEKRLVSRDVRTFYVSSSEAWLEPRLLIAEGHKVLQKERSIARLEVSERANDVHHLKRARDELEALGGPLNAEEREMHASLVAERERMCEEIRDYYAALLPELFELLEVECALWRWYGQELYGASIDSALKTGKLPWEVLGLDSEQTWKQHIKQELLGREFFSTRSSWTDQRIDSFRLERYLVKLDEGGYEIDDAEALEFESDFDRAIGVAHEESFEGLALKINAFVMRDRQVLSQHWQQVVKALHHYAGVVRELPRAYRFYCYKKVLQLDTQQLEERLGEKFPRQARKNVHGLFAERPKQKAYSCYVAFVKQASRDSDFSALAAYEEWLAALSED